MHDRPAGGAIIKGSTPMPLLNPDRHPGNLGDADQDGLDDA